MSAASPDRFIRLSAAALRLKRRLYATKSLVLTGELDGYQDEHNGYWFVSVDSLHRYIQRAQAPTTRAA